MATTYGITGFGGYIPRLRMQRAAIAAAHKWMAPGLRGLGKGQRAFCSWDEDTNTMAVEAARDALDKRQLVNLGLILVVQAAIDFSVPQISAAAHISGLLIGLVLGLLLSPQPQTAIRPSVA